MPIGKSTEESTRTGVYHVKESGLEYQHLRNETIPKDGKEYLDRFRYVDTNAMKRSVLPLAVRKHDNQTMSALVPVL